ncbi:MAG: penicillin acylase family protein [Ilumatobacteraceae bacterium]
MHHASKRAPSRRRWIASLTAVALVAAACSGDDESSDTTDTVSDTTGTDTTDTTDRAPATTASPDTTDVPATTDAPADTTPATTESPDEPAVVVTEDRSYYILPPGNYGGLPTNDDSLDQLPLYDALTPLRGDVTDADIEEFFLPQDFAPIGETTIEETGRDGLTIEYDEFGIPHITGETRDDVSFGAGWVAARDRALLIDLGRRARWPSPTCPGSTPSRWSRAGRRSCRARPPNSSSPTRCSSSSTPTANSAKQSSPTPRPTPTA